MEPLTELYPVDGPVVYGCLRLARISSARWEALVAALGEYCRQHELRLSGLFTERSRPAVGAAAFTGLLDVLALPGAYGVVVPAVSHLGTKAVAAEREKRIEQAGARLLLLRDLRLAPTLRSHR